MKSPSKAYSYIRFSTPEQRHGDSYRRQSAKSAAFALKNGLLLDENLTYKDLGVSAFDKSNVLTGELGIFLKAVESGLVPKGSYLLVESLDRLTRAAISDALEIFLSIINREIKIVTLVDDMVYSKEKLDKQLTDIIVSIVILSRAHEESLTKSVRLKDTWAEKREQITKLKLTATAPGWLKLSDDRSEYLPIQDRVKLVQDIFEWTKDGVGTGTITKRLNQSGTPCFNVNAKMWYDSYIQKILFNRAVLGEFQPHKYVGKDRVPEGSVISNYFPPIISPSLFNLAHASRASRSANGRGRKGVGISNLFSGVLKCGYCHGSITHVNKGYIGPRARLLVCTAAKAGKGCIYAPWEYLYFEKSVLTFCHGLDLQSFLQPKQGFESETTVLAEKINALRFSLESVEKRETNILSAIEEGAKFIQFEKRMAELSIERVRVEKDLLELEKQYEEKLNAKIDIDTASSTLKEFVELMNKKTGDDLHDLRLGLSQQIKNVISNIFIYPVGYIESSKHIEEFRTYLIEKGLSAKEVDDHIKKNLAVRKNADQRFFTMISRTGSVRMIQPNNENPELLNIEIPKTDFILENGSESSNADVLIEFLTSKIHS